MPYASGTCRGCGVDCDGTRCDGCRGKDAERARVRRAELKAAGRCTVCSRRAVSVGGVRLTVCRVHREYYAERARQ